MTPSSILEQLDDAAGESEFPMLDNGYVYPADVRLTIFRDPTRWLMIIEDLGAFSPRVTGCDSFQDCLYLFGNALHRMPGSANEDFLYPVYSLPDEPLFEDEYQWFIRPGAKALELRGQRVEFDVSDKALARKGIELLDPPQIDPAAVLRSLLPKHREALLASEEELAARNPHQLPLWLRLDEWFHPNLAEDELPSACETFQMLADAIASGDPSRYRPTKQPNTHWKNWPEGGTL